MKKIMLLAAAAVATFRGPVPADVRHDERMTATQDAAASGFVLRKPAVHIEGNDLFIASSIMNGFGENVHNVRVTSMAIRTFPAGTAPTMVDPELPMNRWLGDIAPRNSKGIASRWSTQEFKPGEKYIFTVSGTYEDGDYRTLAFSVEGEFSLPESKRADWLDLSIVGTAHAAASELNKTPKIRELNTIVRLSKADGLWSYSIVNDSRESISGLNIEIITGAKIEIASSPTGWIGQISKTGTAVYWTSNDKPVAPGRTLGGFAIKSSAHNFVTTTYAVVSVGSEGKMATGNVHTPDKE